MLILICIMAVGHGFHVLRLAACFLLFIFILTSVVSPSELFLACKPSLHVSCRRSAPLSVAVNKESKRGTNVVALPFDANVTLQAYFALCCDVSSNPGPECHSSRHEIRYTRNQLADIGKSMCSTGLSFDIRDLTQNS